MHFHTTNTMIPTYKHLKQLLLIFLLIIAYMMSSCVTHREAKQAQKYWFYQEIEKDKKIQKDEEKRRAPIVYNRYMF